MGKKMSEEEGFVRFKAWLLEMSDLYGVNEDKEVAHHVQLLVEAIERHTFDAENGPVRKAKVSPCRKFLAIFNNNYRLMMDSEYRAPITAPNMKTIEILIGKLAEIGCDVDDYLQWVFDVFLPENEKFCPPTTNTVCSNFLFDKFRFVFRDEIKKRQQECIVRAAERDLFNRSKDLFARTKDFNIKKMSDDYRAGNISIDDWRKKIIEIEAAFPAEEKTEKISEKTSER